MRDRLLKQIAPLARQLSESLVALIVPQIEHIRDRAIEDAKAKLRADLDALTAPSKPQAPVRKRRRKPRKPVLAAPKLVVQPALVTTRAAVIKSTAPPRNQGADPHALLAVRQAGTQRADLQLRTGEREASRADLEARPVLEDRSVCPHTRRDVRRAGCGSSCVRRAVVRRPRRHPEPVSRRGLSPSRDACGAWRFGVMRDPQRTSFAKKIDITNRCDPGDVKFFGPGFSTCEEIA